MNKNSIVIDGRLYDMSTFDRRTLDGFKQSELRKVESLKEEIKQARKNARRLDRAYSKKCRSLMVNNWLN